MEINTIIKQNKNKLINIAIIILAVIIASNIYKKQAKDIQAFREKNNVEIKKNKVLQDIRKLEDKINAYKYLLAGREANLTINNISSIAKETSVKIISIRPESQQRHSDYILIPFNLTLNAPNYDALGNFISRLESNETVYIVNSIDIKSESLRGDLTVNLRVSSVKYIN